MRGSESALHNQKTGLPPSATVSLLLPLSLVCRKAEQSDNQSKKAQGSDHLVAYGQPGVQA